MFTNELRKREQKYEEKQIAKYGHYGSASNLHNQRDESSLLPTKRQRGRKTKSRVLEEQNALDELRKKRKKLITVLH